MSHCGLQGIPMKLKITAAAKSISSCSFSIGYFEVHPCPTWTTQAPLMHKKNRNTGVKQVCTGGPFCTPETEKLSQGKGSRLSSSPFCTWWPAVGQWTPQSSLESPGCGLAPCPYGAAAGEVCRGSEETQSTSLHQGCKKRVVPPCDSAL